jgi:pimeloyl-ACP methyl ester carboxylesterase
VSSEVLPSPADDALARDEALPDLDWTQLPDGARASWFAAPSGSLAAIEAGPSDGQRVILVPGVTGSKEDFFLMIPLLVDAGFSVLAYDMAGQYESREAGPEHMTPPRSHYDHDLFVDDLVAILESSPRAAHVLGYSFAGTVAQLAYVRVPHLFRSLTLLSAPPQTGQGFRGVKRVGWFSGLATGHIGAGFMLWGVRRNVTKVPPLRLEFVRSRLALTRRSSVDDIIGLMMHAPDVRAQVRAAEVPKLVAVGEHDLWPVELHANLAEAIGARLAVYRTGHSPCETAPHQLVRDLLALFAAAS